MNIYKILKKVLKLITASFLVQTTFADKRSLLQTLSADKLRLLSEAMGQTLVYDKSYEIKCPERTFTERYEDKSLTEGYRMTTNYLNGHGIYGANDTAIIGNSEWKLIPYSYSAPNATKLRVGAYSIPSHGACFLFDDGLVNDPSHYECYYTFAKNNYYRSPEGIDSFGLITKLRGKSFTQLSSLYIRRVGDSVYSTRPVKCGGVRTLKYMEEAKYCSSSGFTNDRCKFVSSKPSISDAGLKSINETIKTCTVKEVIEEKQSSITSEKEAYVSDIITKFFNKTRECNCNCNFNINQNSYPSNNSGKRNNKKDADITDTNSHQTHKPKRKERSMFCTIM